jgi:hypothetical protein
MLISADSSVILQLQASISTIKYISMYKHVWNKYLPVIRILMKRSASGPQKLALNRTDFEKVSRSRKAYPTFHIELENGKLTTATPPVPAKDLVASLLEDEISKNLLRQHNYKFSLKADLELSITDLTPSTQEPSESEQQAVHE